MADRPIIFSAPMVRALLAGRKVQTRRLLKPQPDPRTAECSVSGITRPCQWMGLGPSARGGTSQWDPWRPLRFSPGDRLYVRENWRVSPEACEGWHPDEMRGWIDYQAGGSLECTAPSFEAIERATFLKTESHDWDFIPSRYRPCIHMPRWTSRFTLMVEAVKIERLQAISEEDAQAEGAAKLIWDGEGRWYESDSGTYRSGFAGIWQHLHGTESWDADPWVIALTFRVEGGNIDRLPLHHV